MEKKMEIYILLIGVLLAIGYVGFIQFHVDFDMFDEKLQVGELTFDMPEGFHEESRNGTIVNINNGEIPIQFNYFEDDKINHHVDQYVLYCSNLNLSTTVSNFTVDNIDVYKAINNDEGSTTYWFVHNGYTYHFIIWKHYEKSDSLLYNLLSSLSSTDPS